MDDRLPVQQQPFTVVLDYYATGEGVTQQVAVLMAADQNSAKEKFLTLHGYEGAGRDYFRVGVEVYAGVDTDVLSRMLTPKFIAGLERTVWYGVFILSRRFNAS